MRARQPLWDSARRGASRPASWLAMCLMLGCGGGAEEPEDPSGLPKTPPPLVGADDAEEGADAGAASDGLDRGLAGWQAATRSPQPLPGVSAADEALYRLCGEPDRALAGLAGRILDRRLDGLSPYSPRQLELLMRIAGLPQVWPRAWAVAGLTDGTELAQRLAEWAQLEPVRGRRRCGLARGADAEGRSLLAVVTVDALADVEPLPTRVRPSQWVDLRGALHVAADAVHVLLLGPRGRPRKVLASLSGTQFRSRFSLDQPGPWLVQVLADSPSGPVPVLEARMFAGVAPPQKLADPPAPGRSVRLPASPSAADYAHALARLLNAARRSEGTDRLQTDARLSALAHEHAAAMAQRGRLAHDVGRGTVDQRLQAAGWKAVHVGENVAAARSVERAHQALWASPSHRNNVLEHGFRRVGIGVVADADGTLWVTQIFSE